MIITAGNKLFIMLLAAIEQEIPTMVTSPKPLCGIITQVGSQGIPTLSHSPSKTLPPDQDVYQTV